MATARKTQIEKIETALRKNTKSPGVTAATVARLAKVPYDAVSKRIHDLRESYTIYTNYRIVNGKRTAYYRFAG